MSNKKSTAADPATPSDAQHPKWRPELIKFDPETGVQITDGFGREIPDPVPLEPPLGFVEAPSMFDIVQQQVRRELNRIAEVQGVESLEDAFDFDIPDDPMDAQTQYEHDLDLDKDALKHFLEPLEPSPPPPATTPPAPPAEPSSPSS